MSIHIPVSAAELIDKITILEIKCSEFTDSNKLANVKDELDALTEVVKSSVNDSLELEKLHTELRLINKKIWDSENDVRQFWNDDEKFNAGAKQSHYYNDERARVKKEINQLLGSSIIEEKSHPAYEHKV
ncbi:MAG: DUF6165 family protein [Candidatus Pacebacteria bacterium]|nr:DUF6165 family protein [Candidatus Paceibacterota bacterium]MCF7856946.1 DUF6165 family protein [Candidatus Paceibacterota bacterium]